MNTLLLAADFAAKRHELARDSAQNAEAYYDGAMRAELKRRWRPIEEAIQDGRKYILWDHEIVDVGSSYGFGWKDYHGYEIFPTHFMPLPEPPNGK